MSDKVQKLKDNLDGALKIVNRLEQRNSKRKLELESHKSIDKADSKLSKTRSQEKLRENEDKCKDGTDIDAQRTNEILKTRDEGCLNKDIEEEKKDIEGLRSLLKDTMGMICEDEQMKKSTKSSWPWGSSSPSKTVQILIQAPTELLQEFVKEITTDVKKSNKVQLEAIYDVKKLNPNEKFIVVCPSTSRLESDMSSALEGIFRSHIIVVIVLHTQRGNHLPTLSSSTKLTGKPEYRDLRFIDMTFTPENKMCVCEMNTNAKSTLKSILDKM